MALFLSNFTNKIDSKGRVSVPAQFRASLTKEDNSSIVVYESFINECIEGCNLDRMKKISDSIDDLDVFSKERDSLAMSMLGSSIQLIMDVDGRVILPANLLKKAQIKDSAVFVGKGPTFETWSPKMFEEYSSLSKVNAMKNLNLIKLKK